MRVLLTLPPELAAKLAAIYQKLEEEYNRIAGQISLTCQDCPDNCCDSWFFHHTYSEWAWLWQGLNQLDEASLDRITARAEDYLQQSEEQLAAGQTPRIMCPLNEEGRCCIYEHRLLICRMHGIPVALTRPQDKQVLRFPGCFRCQKIVKEKYSKPDEAPFMDRTHLFSQLAALEAEFLGGSGQLYPKIKKTIAELIVQGPPAIHL
jgi:hypothetical protein